MGYNISVLVFSDCLHDIANDPEFGANLSRACSYLRRGEPALVKAGASHGAAKVIESRHSTEYSALLFGGNTVRNISNGAWLRDGQTDLEVLQAIADKMGFELVEKLESSKISKEDRDEHLFWERAADKGLIDSVGGMEWMHRHKGTHLVSEEWLAEHEQIANSQE